MKAIETYKKHGVTIEIHHDEDPESPREWGNAGTMVCWHSRYNLGDKHDHKTPRDLRESLAADSGLDDEQLENMTDAEVSAAVENAGVVMLPLRLYDHSGISMSTSSGYPYNDQWDAGQVGWIYAAAETIQEEWGKYAAKNGQYNIAPHLGDGKRGPDEWITVQEAVRRCLVQEVKTYDEYLTGQVYGYVVDPDGADDSCWGFFDLEYCKKQAEDAAKQLAKERKAERAAARERAKYTAAPCGSD